MRTGRSSRAGRSEQVELHRDDGGPSEERDEEGGVVTLGAGAGRCPGPARCGSGTKMPQDERRL